MDILVIGLMCSLYSRGYFTAMYQLLKLCVVHGMYLGHSDTFPKKCLKLYKTFLANFRRMYGIYIFYSETAIFSRLFTCLTV
jgi:hypothetical protein